MHASAAPVGSSRSPAEAARSDPPPRRPARRRSAARSDATSNVAPQVSELSRCTDGKNIITMTGVLKNMLSRSQFAKVGVTHLQHISIRSLWGMLNAVFNQVDQSRIREVGPDRAASEWLLRCGASVRFKNFEKWTEDYNLLPAGGRDKLKIVEIDATDSCIMHIGFEHFNNLEHLSYLKLHHCTYLQDLCVSKLIYLKDCLQELQISSCGDVSDKGLATLTQLHKLEKLFLCDLPAVKDMDGIINILGAALPDCEIRYLSLEGLKDLKRLGKDSIRETLDT